jgi:hypothetical protein
MNGQRRRLGLVGVVAILAYAVEQTTNLLGNSWANSHSTPLLVIIIVLTIVGMWLIVLQFPLDHGNQERSPKKPLPSWSPERARKKPGGSAINRQVTKTDVPAVSDSWLWHMVQRYPSSGSLRGPRG